MRTSAHQHGMTQHGTELTKAARLQQNAQHGWHNQIEGSPEVQQGSAAAVNNCRSAHMASQSSQQDTTKSFGRS